MISSRKSATPKMICEALAMREAGYSVLSISQSLGMSVRTLQRMFAQNGAKKGALKQALIDAARNELLARFTSDERVQSEVAKLINDDLAHCIHLRLIMLEASEALKANSLSEAVLVMRAAAAYSTALKNTSDTFRRSFGADRIIDSALGDTPELVIRELDATEVADMRAGDESDSIVDTSAE